MIRCSPPGLDRASGLFSNPVVKHDTSFGAVLVVDAKTPARAQPPKPF